MKTLRGTLKMVVLAALAAGIASADSISFTVTIGPTDTDITDTLAQLTGWNPGGSISPFDFDAASSSSNSITTMHGISSGATLLSYNITDTATLSGNFTVTNTSSSSTSEAKVGVDSVVAASIGAFLAPPLTFNSDPANDVFGGNGPDPATFTEPVSKNGFSTGVLAENGGTFTSPTFNASATANTGVVTSNLGQVKTPGALNLYTSSFSNDDSTASGGNNVFSINTTIAQQITITYDYTSTPEPATLAIMGGALIGLSLLGKRLKKG
jgi:hypothetical protein